MFIIIKADKKADEHDGTEEVRKEALEGHASASDHLLCRRAGLSVVVVVWSETLLATSALFIKWTDLNLDVNSFGRPRSRFC